MPLGMEVGLGPGHIVVDEDPAPQPKGAQRPPPTFRSMSIVAKRSPSEQLLSSCYFKTVCKKYTGYIARKSLDSLAFYKSDYYY